MVGRGRTGMVLVLAVLLLLGAGVGGLLLFQHERADDESAAPPTWDDFRVLERGLVVHATVPACRDVTTVDVVETPDRVDLTLVLDDSDSVCDDPDRGVKRRVRLAGPLGDRDVYDGGCLDDGRGDSACLRYERELPAAG